MTAKTVICAGMQRAMSTWQHRVAAEIIHRHCGGVDLGYVTADRFDELDTGGWQLLKCHAWHDRWARLIAEGRALVLSTSRDLRDVVKSWARFHRRDLADRRTLNSLLNYLLSHDQRWSAVPGALIQRYEDVVQDLQAGILEIGRRLGVELCTEEVTEIEQACSFDALRRHNAHHVHDGRVGYYRALPEQAIAHIERRAGRWLVDHGYPLTAPEPPSVWYSRLFDTLTTLHRGCRQAAGATPLVDSLSVSILGGAAQCLCDPADIDLTPCLARDGYWEPWVSLAIGRFLADRGPAARVLNLGANVGYYTLLAGGFGCRVRAVEAHPLIHGLLQRSIEWNGYDWCTAQWAAVDRNNGQKVGFRLPEDRGLARACRADGQADWHAPSITVDSITRDWDRLDIVICDIEGAEVDAWTGMQWTLERWPSAAWCIEWHGRVGDVRAGRVLSEIADRFPLRIVADDGTIVPVAPGRVLNPPDGHVTLWLQRPPA